jgi:hypothetical protein
MSARTIASIVWKFAAIAFCVTVGACGSRTDVTVEDLVQAEDLEEFNMYASAVKSLGADGIPIFARVIDDSLDSKYDVLSYGKLNSSIFHLHDLASRGTFDLNSVPILIRAIEEQIAIEDTVVTADTLRIITGVDVGYDADFVSNYTPEDEGERRAMIAQWSEWYSENVKQSEPQQR